MKRRLPGRQDNGVILQTGPGTVCFAAGPRSSWAGSESTGCWWQVEGRNRRAPRGERSRAEQALPAGLGFGKFSWRTAMGSQVGL